MSPFSILLVLLLAVVSFAQRDNGYTDYVQWDEHSLLVDGDRLFVFSGEFHYQRLPNPDLWADIFQRFKSSGLNAVSIYFFWSYHSASPDVFDFSSPGKDVQRLLDEAKAAGLYVIARPGPYCNAETSAGGIALWGTDGSAGDLRTSDETYYEAWKPWIREIGGILKRNQVTEGGPVLLVQVENELQELVHEANNTLVLYMEQIKKELRDLGIVVPFTSNEKGMRSQSWSTDYMDVGGAVDIYGLDSYPGGLSCSNPSSGFTLVRTYYQWFQNYSFTQPSLLPEFRGGWFQPWGGFFYDDCESERSPEYPDVFYKNNIANRVTLFNMYMAFGGTNWGHSAAPVVYTSYDYSAPLRETREIQPKFQQTKLIALFTRASGDLLKTNMESNGTGNAANTSDIYTWVLRNPDTFAGFYITQHDNSRSQDDTWFEVFVNTSLGQITVPDVSLDGRQSRIVVTDYNVGGLTLLYSSAEVLTYGIFDVPVLAFYLNPGQVGEIAFKSGGAKNFSTFGAATDFAIKPGNGSSTTFRYTQGSGTSVVKFAQGPVFYLLDRESAYSFFAPSTTTNPAVAPNEQIFVLGPYLVRNASISGEAVVVTGDNANSTTIEVYTGDSSVSSITWNGKALVTNKTEYGALLAELPGAADREISLPALTDWKVADSLPELDPSYDDSRWTVANKTTTLNPVAPITLPVLYGSDYGYYSGILVYRGYFDGRNATSANVTVQGGAAAGWSAWVNGKLAGGFEGNASILTSSDVLDFSQATLQDRDNVLTVVTDYTGHDQDSQGPHGPENPRGILGAQLVGSTFTKWKIQGNAGGAANIDPVRGPQNEGGLLGERLGWHLPGFDDSAWDSGSPADGFTGAGIKWYRTTFSLDIPDDLDVPVGIELSASTTVPARIQLFVNGYQYGKFFPHIGPQTRFPIPPGILNNQGDNVVSLSVWAQAETGAKVEAELFAYGKYVSGFGYARDWSELQPGWTEDRLQYA